MRTKLKLAVTTQGVKGGKKHTNILGSVCCRLLNDYNGESKEITIDNYKGFNDTYQQRDEPLIQIDAKQFVWTGSFDDLTNIITFARSMQWLCQEDKPQDYKAAIETIMQSAQQLFTSNK
jgi:hypothetical protein